MTTIFIRIKSILIFSLIILCAAFIWAGSKGVGFYKEAMQKELLDKTSLITADTPSRGSEPVVAITTQENNLQKDNFFSEYRIERERTRSQQVEILREIVNNQNSSAQVRQEAQQKLIKISESLEKESKIENALIAKGFKEAVVVIQQNSVMVIVQSAGLRQDEIARISDIVIKVTDCKMEDVIIVPKTV